MTQKPTLNRGFAKAGVANTGAAKSTVASTGKKQWQPKPDHVGYLTTSKSGNQIIKVEQDIVLEKGTILILKDPAAEKAGLVQRGYISQEEADAQLEKTKFIEALVKIVPKMDKD